jgi:hypothetical protein
MKIHSDILTKADIAHAVYSLPGVYIDELTEHGSRRRAKGFKLYLNGNSRYAAQRGGKAATWDEWGIVINRLFEIDPTASMEYYATRGDFYAQTAHVHNTILRHYGPEQAKRRGQTAPWL